jgi:hypothetical protein
MGNERPGESGLNSTNGVEEGDASTRPFEAEDEVEVANVSQEETQKSRRRSSIYTKSTLPSVGASTESHSLYERRSARCRPLLGWFPSQLVPVGSPSSFFTTPVRMPVSGCGFIYARGRWGVGADVSAALSWCSNIPLHGREQPQCNTVQSIQSKRLGVPSTNPQR